ncbi:hypothetical protein DRN73_05805 [Candidatus Pacearchaeota archaeon]|nr:MAG: hypothetical protein DRN73_05805 [Candidatus Pacearchaeota archaeon]
MKNKEFQIFVFIFFLFLLKFFYLLKLPLLLSFDESYYWDWSRHLDWGYYSKPPMIAWVIAFSTKIFGISEWAIRLPALISLIFTLLISYLLIKKYFSQEIAFWLVLTLAFVPMFTIYSVVITPDSLLLFFWVLSLYFAMLYLENMSYKNAILTGIFIGLGLLTKQTVIAFLGLAFLYLLFWEKSKLWNKKTWLIPLTAFLIYLPNLYWNLNHNLILLKHTEEHFTREVFSFAWWANFFLGDLIAYSPIFFLFFLFYGFKFLYKLKSFKSISYLDRFFLFTYFFSFFPVIFFLIIAFFIRLDINWILPFVFSGYFWVVIFLIKQKKYKIIKINLIISVLLSFLICLIPFYPSILPFNTRNLLKKFEGWEKLAKEVEKYYKRDIPILASDRHIASSLAFYMQAHPEIYVYQKTKFPKNQYHLWRKDRELIGRKIIVVKKFSDSPKYLKNKKKLADVILKQGKRIQHYSIWEGIFYKK